MPLFPFWKTKKTSKLRGISTTIGRSFADSGSASSLLSSTLPLAALFCLFSYSPQLCSQIENDAQIWSNLAIAAPVNDDLRLILSHSWRQRENFSSFSQTYLQLRASYQTPLKALKISPGYRYTFRPEDRSNTQRYFVDIQLGKRFKPIDIRLRSRFQMQHSNKLDWQTSEYFFREKIKIAYRKKKKADWIPYIMGELFFDAGNQWEMTRYRIGGGLDWKFKKRQELGLSIRMQHNYSESAPSRDFLFALGYEYTLKQLRKSTLKPKQN